MSAVHATLAREMAWLQELVEAALRHHFGAEAPSRPDPPQLGADDPAARLLAHLAERDRLILALALAPHLAPETLDAFLIRNSALDRGFTEFGGVVEANGGFRPTVGTAGFLTEPGGVSGRLAALARLGPGEPLPRLGLLDVAVSPEAPFDTPLRLAPDALQRLAAAAPAPMAAEAALARPLELSLLWDDLVLPRQTMAQLEEIVAWIEHGRTILADATLRRHLQPGYRALLHGPPGCGKTLAAGLIGARTGRTVWRVDLARVVSKWIGETEKNLAALFDRMDGERGILFFDEADALFGRRTDVKGANDRFANQETAYILQRVEDFSGVAILASNLRANIDEAFARRFQSVIHIPKPGERERERLWRAVLAEPGLVADGIDPAALAARHELTGAGIVNALRHAALAVRRADRSRIDEEDIVRGIQREIHKEGRMSDWASS